MTDPTPAEARARAFAALVERLVREPAAVLAHREMATALVRSLATGALTLRVDVEGIVVDDLPVDLPVLAGRLQAYGVEELTLTPRTMMADLLELARLVAAEPKGADPAGTFAVRAAVLDADAMPRRFRGADRAFAPLEVERTRRASGAMLQVSPSLIAETPLSATRLTVGGAAALTPARPSAQLQPLAALAVRASTALPALPEPMAADGTIVPVPRLSRAAIPRAARASRAVPTIAAARRARREILRPTAPLEMPDVADAALAAALAACIAAETDRGFAAAATTLARRTALAFRQGRDQPALAGAVALAVLEHRLVDTAGAGARLSALDGAFRTAVDPTALRHLALLRRVPAGDREAAWLDAVLWRAGVDGAEALVESCLTAAAPASHTAAVEALRVHPRAFDALEELARDTRDLMLREAAALLGELGGPIAEVILSGALAHPDPFARAAVVLALGRIGTPAALNTVTTALTDAAPVVRHRALAVLGAHRPDDLALRVRAVIDGDPDPGVWEAAVALLGAVPTPDGVDALVAIANGAGRHPESVASERRLAACRALVAARVPAGMTAVDALRRDQDAAVRDGAQWLLAGARRRTTATGMTAIPE